MAPPVQAPAPRPSYVNVPDARTNAQAQVTPAEPPPDDGVEKVAVIVTHGMGQQVPFETLEMLANAVRREASLQNPGTPSPRVATRVVRLGTKGEPTEPQLPRAELRLTLPDGSSRDVHFYEVYWAPITEGKVTIRDVIGFLFSAGWLGITNTFQGQFFERWMFGAFQRFQKKTWTLFLSFVVAFAELGSLVLINGIIAAVATSKMLTGGKTDWPTPELRAALTFDMLFIVAGLGLIGMGVFLVPRVLRHLAWALVWTGIVALPIVAFLMALHIALPPTHPAWHQNILETKLLLFGLWGCALLASSYIRKILIQYVGDVAAYINAHTVSKFWTIRKDIYETAMRVFSPVYKSRRNEEVIYEWERHSLDGKLRPQEARPVPRFQYEKVFVVGHSLGSVICYDSLNGLLLEDELSAPALYVPQRTKLLLTFGSPLDKTAFIFRTHKEKESEIREGAAAAAVQPMIVSYFHRPRRWVNIFSRNDWVSGSLEFYDTNPPPPAPVIPPLPPLRVLVPVENVEDPDANRPLLAHIQYWDNALLRQELYAGLMLP
jgi:hypothetical protein